MYNSPNPRIANESNYKSSNEFSRENCFDDRFIVSLRKMYRYYKKCRPSPRLLFLSDSKWIINIRRNVSVSSIKNFVLDSDSERLICISLDTIVFIINSLGKWWKKRRFAWELFIFGFNYLQKDTILSTIFFF